MNIYFWSVYLSLTEINSQYQVLLIYNYLRPTLSKLLTQCMHVNIVRYRFIGVNLPLLLFKENKICEDNSRIKDILYFVGFAHAKKAQRVLRTLCRRSLSRNSRCLCRSGDARGAYRSTSGYEFKAFSCFRGCAVCSHILGTTTSPSDKTLVGNTFQSANLVLYIVCSMMWLKTLC